MEGREVDLLGSAGADVDDVDARVRQPLANRRREIGAREADVVADRDHLGFQPRRVGARDRQDQLAVQLRGNASANVVSLETGKLFQTTHGVVS